MSINDLQFKDEVEDQIPADGQLPELGSYTPPLPPDKEYMVRIPANIEQLISLKDVTQDKGKPTEVTRQRVFVKFDKANPLVILGGDHDGHPIMTTISNIPRPRGKDKIPVSDMAYFLIDGCHLTVAPKTPKDWVDALLRAANLTAKIRSGRTGQCRDDQDIYIESVIVDPESGQQSVSYQEVQGMKGCGKRYYTSAFRLPSGVYVERLACTGKRKFADPVSQIVTEVQCGASIRGFDGVDRWLK